MHLQCLPPTRYVSGCGRNDDPYLPHVGLGSIGMAATRETKYTVCTYCRVTITPYKKLLEHVTAAHRGKRPFECLQCGRTFTQQAHRDAHLRIHTGERPYVCDKCGDSFKQSGHPQRHKEDTMNLSVSFHSNVTNVYPHLPRSGIWICMI